MHIVHYEMPCPCKGALGTPRGEKGGATKHNSYSKAGMCHALSVQGLGLQVPHSLWVAIVANCHKRDHACDYWAQLGS